MWNVKNFAMTFWILEDYEGDKKLVVVDKVMEELNKLHEQYRPEYERVYKETTGEEVDIDQG